MWRGRGGWPGEIVISSHQLRPSCEIVNKNDADQASCWVQHSCSKRGGNWVWVGELIADQSCTLEKKIGIAKTTKSGAIKSKAKTPSISGCNQESFSQQEGRVADQGECKVGNDNKNVEHFWCICWEICNENKVWQSEQKTLVLLVLTLNGLNNLGYSCHHDQYVQYDWLIIWNQLKAGRLPLPLSAPRLISHWTLRRVNN